MSRSRQEKLRCTKCGNQQSFTVWESINVTVDPDLKGRLLSGELTTFRCKTCGNEGHVAYNCLYHDMDNALAIWLSDDDSDNENARARHLFSSTVQLEITRKVRTIHELYDKIRVFDDGLDDLEIELLKFSLCVRQQMDLSTPFHYAETQKSFLGRKSLLFVLESGGEYQTIKCPLKNYELAIRPLATRIRPLLDESALEWAQLDREFILNALKIAGLLEAVGPNAAPESAVQVHTIGRRPEFSDPHAFDEWLHSGDGTYKMETWQVGKDVSIDQAKQYRDRDSGALYVYYQIVEGEWKGRFVTRELFAELKKIEESR